MRVAIRMNLLVSFLMTVGAAHGQIAWQQAIRASEQLQTDGKPGEAERELLAVLRDEAPPQAGLAYIYNNLGSLCQDQGRFSEANRYYRRSIAEWEQVGEQRLALARTLNNLASLLWDTGRQAEAERILVRALGIQIGAAGPENPEAAILHYNLAAVQFSRKHWSEARDGVPPISGHPRPTGRRSTGNGSSRQQTGPHMQASGPRRGSGSLAG